MKLEEIKKLDEYELTDYLFTKHLEFIKEHEPELLDYVVNSYELWENCRRDAKQFIKVMKHLKRKEIHKNDDGIVYAFHSRFKNASVWCKPNGEVTGISPY